MNSRLAAAVSVLVVAVVAAAFLINVQQGATTTSSQTATSISTGGSYVNGLQNLQLRLSANASASGGSGGVTIKLSVEEYNTLAAANNVSSGSQWPLDGLSLGSCGTEAYPFGVAVYSGLYTSENASKAEPLHIYPAVPCPMLIRLVTGYLFQPTSDLAIILPSGPDAKATPMSANVTAAAEYTFGAGQSSSSSSRPLSPGTYTVAAGDEWGSLVLVHFTVGPGATTTNTSSSASSSATGAGTKGTLEATFEIGPIQPVCMANATVGPAPSQYSSIAAVVTSQSSGQALTFPVSWLSNGCSVSGSLEASLAPGAYTINLSSCQFMGCGRALPKSFVVAAGQPTLLDVSLDTGIR